MFNTKSHTKIKDIARLLLIFAILAIVGAFGTLWYSSVKIQMIREEYSELEPKLQQLKIEKVQLDKDKKDLSKETEQLNEDKTKLETEKTELEKQIENLPGELETLRAQVKQKEEELKTATENGASLQTQLDNARTTLAEKTNEAAKLQGELERIKSVLQTQEDIVACIKDLIRKNESHATEMAEMRSERDSAIRDYNTAQSRLNGCKDAYRSYINAARGNAETKPWWVQLPSYYGISGPDAF